MLSGQVECAAGTFKRRYNAATATSKATAGGNLQSAAGPSLDGAPDTRLPAAIPALGPSQPVHQQPSRHIAARSAWRPPKAAHALQADPLHLNCLRSSKREAVVCGWAWPRTERRPLAKRRSYISPRALDASRRLEVLEPWSQRCVRERAPPPCLLLRAVQRGGGGGGTARSATYTLLSRNSFNSNSHKCVVCA